MEASCLAMRDAETPEKSMSFILIRISIRADYKVLLWVKSKDMKLLVCIFILFDISGALYTDEPPVKLLEVVSLAARFPASQSQYRVSMENGYVRTALSISPLISW